MLTFTTLPFASLTPDQLYAALRLRSEVFVVEQACVFLDMDDKDQHCYHLLAYQNNDLVAYTRLVPPGVIYDEPSIGRVVSAPSARGTGAGRSTFQKSIEATEELFGLQPIKIGAQLYLKSFYENFGFQQIGEGYIEDGIPHIYMLRTV